jgi:chromate transporter
VKGVLCSGDWEILGASLGRIAINNWLIRGRLRSLIVLSQWKVRNPMLVAATAVLGIIAFPILSRIGCS